MLKRLLAFLGPVTEDPLRRRLLQDRRDDPSTPWPERIAHDLDGRAQWRGVSP